MRYFLTFILMISTNANAQKAAAALWEGTTESEAYREFVSAYGQELASHGASDKARIRFDAQKSVYTVYNRPSKEWIFLASKKSIAGRKLSTTAMNNLVSFASDCSRTHVDISFHDSSPNGAGVYLDSSQIGDEIKNGRFSFRTMGICREVSLVVEVSKTDCSTHTLSFLVPASGPAKVSEVVNLKCPPQKKKKS